MKEKQPRGVLTLAMVEMWERFSFYGMVAILVLYLIRPEDGPFPPGPGQGFTEGDAAALFGVYSALVLGAPLVGGWIGDRLIGPRRALVIGGILIATGHFILLVPGIAVFWAGLLVIAAGTGLLKPNISTVLGLLYSEGDPRRDGGFSLFYLGINVGAFTAPLICGWLATAYSWRLAFAVAGVGMVAGLVQYAFGRHRLRRDRPSHERAEITARASARHSDTQGRPSRWVKTRDETPDFSARSRRSMTSRLLCPGLLTGHHRDSPQCPCAHQECRAGRRPRDPRDDHRAG